jgi:polyferredoxin
MEHSQKKMKPIWYFVGLMLFVMGLIVTVSGIFYYFNPPPVRTALYSLHADIWWGLFMTVAGLIFFLANRNRTIE